MNCGATICVTVSILVTSSLLGSNILLSSSTSDPSVYIPPSDRQAGQVSYTYKTVSRIIHSLFISFGKEMGM
jgi:hypothetical protein